MKGGLKMSAVEMTQHDGMSVVPDDRFAVIAQLQRDLAKVESDGIAIMHLIVRYAARLTRADGVAVEMLEGDETIYRAVYGIMTRFGDQRLPRSHSLTGLAVLTTDVIQCTDTDTDARVDRAACQKVGIRSFVVMPLHHKGQFIGGLEVLSASPRAFDARDAESLQVLAGFLAPALSRVRSDESNQELMNECSTALGALLDSEERYRRFVELSPDAIVVHAKGQFLFANSATARLFGVRNVGEIVGTSLYDFVPPDELEERRRQTEREYTSWAEYPWRETYYVRANGEPVLVESASVPIDYHGQQARMSVLRDLTERRSAELALRISESQYRSVVAALEEGILVQDRTGAILTMNASAERIFGFTFADAEEHIGVNPKTHAVYEDGSFFPDDEHPAMVVLRTGVPESHVIMGFQHEGEEVIWLSVNARPLFHPGEALPYAVVSSFTDITKRKQQDEALRQFSEELQRSNRELQDFAAVTSHDLREPLRKIQAFGSRLEGRCKDDLSTEGRDYLARMLDAAARMEQLIDDILVYSRVSSKAQPFEPVDLNAIVGAVVDDLEVRIEQTGATVTVDTLPVIEADPMQMRQLFQNLIGNALKFTMEGIPPIVKVTGHIAPSRERGKNARAVCHLLVQDNGIGFDEKYLEKVFTVFQRLNNRSQYEGSGVGLAICRKIVERHGGKITARSAPGEGATFVITLPNEQRTS